MRQRGGEREREGKGDGGESEGGRERGNVSVDFCRCLRMTRRLGSRYTKAEGRMS
jgi:hypothetical protein